MVTVVLTVATAVTYQNVDLIQTVCNHSVLSAAVYSVGLRYV